MLVQISASNSHLPRPKSDKEAEPREEEYAAIEVDRVESRNRARLVIDRIDLGSFPEHSWIEAHFRKAIWQSMAVYPSLIQ